MPAHFLPINPFHNPLSLCIVYSHNVQMHTTLWYFLFLGESLHIFFMIMHETQPDLLQGKAEFHW